MTTVEIRDEGGGLALAGADLVSRKRGSLTGPAVIE